MSDQNRKITDRIELRPVMPDDEEFLKALYCTTRYDVERLPFDDEGKKAFMLMQYAAQKKHYDEYYAGASHDIVLYDGEPVGRYMIEPVEDEIIGVDLAIMPEYRSLGIGSTLIKSTLKEAEETNRPFVFHVVKDNERAIKLYKRLGCQFTGDAEVHYKMTWTAGTAEEDAGQPQAENSPAGKEKGE